MTYIFLLIFNLTLAFAEHVSPVTMGAGNAFASAYNLPALTQRSFTQNLQLNSVRAATYLAARTAFYGPNALKDMHKDAINVVLQSLCADLCKDIGAAYKSVDSLGNVIDGKLDYFSHKLLHAFTGAFGGAVHGVEGMAAGAAGAVAGEVLGEFVLNNASMIQKMRNLQEQGVDQATILKDHVDVKAFLVKLTASIGVGLFGLDTQIAYDGADRAIENNLIPTLLVLAGGALMGAYTAMTLDELLNAYEGLVKLTF